MFTIYKLENLVNGKKYIGYAKNYHSRVSQHLSNLRNQCHEVHALQKDFNTFGITAFSFCILAYATNKSHAALVEHSLILEFGTLNHNLGYNKSTCKGWSPESRFRDSERKYLRSRKYQLLPGIELPQPVHEYLINSFKPS